MWAACADADGGGGGDGGGRFVQNMLYMRMQHGDVYVVQCLFELSRWLQMTKWQFLKGILITSIQFVELQPDWKNLKPDRCCAFSQ